MSNNNFRKTHWCIVILLVICSYTVKAQTSLADSINNAIAEVEAKRAWVNSIGQNATIDAPFGIKKTLGFYDYVLVFATLNIGKQGAICRAYGKVTTPFMDQSGKAICLYFVGNTELSRFGGIVGGNKLALASNVALAKNNSYSVNLLSGINSSDGTFFEIDCDGYKQMQLSGNMTLSNSYLPVNEANGPIDINATKVVAAFKENIATLDDAILNVKFNYAFAHKDFPGYIIRVRTAQLDMSTKSNPSGGDDLNGYLLAVQGSKSNIWRGVYINYSLVLPEQFNSDVYNRATITGGTGIIESSGFTGLANGIAVLPADKGSASGWGFSVDSFRYSVTMNKLSGRFTGTIKPPLRTDGDKDLTIAYTATIINKDFTFKASNPVAYYRLPFWKAYIRTNQSSYLNISTVENMFYPKLVLFGNMDIGESKYVGGVRITDPMFSSDGIGVEELTLEPKGRRIGIKAVKTSTAKSRTVYFSAMLTSFDTLFTGDEANFKITTEVTLMDDRISGKTTMLAKSQYDSKIGYYAYKDWYLDSMFIKADFGKAGFYGYIRQFRADSTYGNGFEGRMKFTVANMAEVAEAYAMFGNANCKYWSVDVCATMDIAKSQIKGFASVNVTGISGGASYHMTLTDEPSKKFPGGYKYVPSSSAGLRIRAGLAFNIVEDPVLKGTGGLELAFNSDESLDEIRLNATFHALSLEEGKKMVVQTLQRVNYCHFIVGKPSLFDDGDPDDGIWGDLTVVFDFENDMFVATLNTYANFFDRVKGAGKDNALGVGSIVIAHDSFNVQMGTRQAPFGIKLDASFVASASGSIYFQMKKTPSVPFLLQHGLYIRVDLDFVGGGFARAGGWVKYDVSLVKSKTMRCEGLNGWYGAGELNVGLYGGVSVAGTKLVYMSMDAYLKFRGLNPLWVNGTISGNVVVWPFINVNFDMSATAGEKCYVKEIDG